MTRVRGGRRVNPLERTGRSGQVWGRQKVPGRVSNGKDFSYTDVVGSGVSRDVKDL